MGRSARSKGAAAGIGRHIVIYSGSATPHATYAKGDSATVNLWYDEEGEHCEALVGEPSRHPAKGSAAATIKRGQRSGGGGSGGPGAHPTDAIKERLKDHAAIKAEDNPRQTTAATATSLSAKAQSDWRPRKTNGSPCHTHKREAQQLREQQEGSS
mgnify:CR=1 FL=1